MAMISFSVSDFINNSQFNIPNSISQFIPQINIINDIPKLSINTNLINLSLSSFNKIVPTPLFINHQTISVLKTSLDNIIPQKVDIAPQLNDLKSSFNNVFLNNTLSKFNTSFDNIAPDISINTLQLHAPTQSDCKQNCIMNHNVQAKCGVPNAITGLMVEEPDAAKCAIDLNNNIQNCLEKCTLIEKTY